jgi:hypothetical protein
MRVAPVADRFDPSLDGAVVFRRDMPARREHQALQPVGDLGEYHGLHCRTDALQSHDGWLARWDKPATSSALCVGTAALVSIVPFQPLTKAANLLFRVRTSALVLFHRHNGMSA